MELTKEQLAILHSTGDIKINAVAGSGKTTTIIEYAKTRPENSQILYLAFNKSVKIEAKNKFEAKGLNNVRVETAHSLAYKNIVQKHGYKLRHQGYKTQEIAELLQISGSGEKYERYVIANHIGKFINYFCNSDKKTIKELNYLESITDEKAKAFVTQYYSYIERQANILLTKMDNAEIEVIHDFYLKKFQLTEPVLAYDYILFDEGQDASATMLDIFLKQPATKVIVGDTHQQIYGWRNAVNSLDKTYFTSYTLSTSFRFSQDIANLASGILDWKKHLEPYTSLAIKGTGLTNCYKSKAIIGRTNLGLLLKAIEYVTEKENIHHIYFEGNITSYTYADEGASLYDVLNLYNGKRAFIRDPLIKTMRDLNELGDYIKKTEDVQLGMMVEIVKEYGNQIPGILKAIKSKHIDSDEKEKAEIIFSTVHRCKGMEYDAIQLINDFITEEKIEKLKADPKKQNLSKSKIKEEINLLYVAVTRTKNSVHMNETLLPKDFPKSPHVFIERSEAVEETLPMVKKGVSIPEPKREKTYSVEKIRETYGEAYAPWTNKQDEELTNMYCMGITTKDLAKHFGRTAGAIRSRVKKLELTEKYG